MMPKHSGEPDLALAGLVLLIIFAFMMWQDRPIQSPRPVDLIDAKQHAPRVTGNSYESWLWQDPFDFDPAVDPVHEKLHEVFLPTNVSQDPFAKNSERDNLCSKDNSLTPGISGTETKILMLSVPITPNTVETKEFRTRYRYAVVSGLIKAGYRPLDPHSFNFCASGRNDEKNKHDVRWEKWEYASNSDSKPEKIFVIWSDSVVPIKEHFNGSHVYEFDSNHTLICLDNPAFYFVDQKCSIKSIKRTDEELIKLLKTELEKRKITNSSEIAIISEYDTKSVREFADEFREQFGESGCMEISNFTYLKGLDAYRRSIGKLEQQEIANKALEKRDKLLSIIDQHNLPAGPGQLDYLYRLATKIKESYNDSDHKKHIKAVGVFGSDFYDKLIVFQALRAEIPNIVLFTTELDAEMLHPQYWHWTRNLIVATPFDLRLKDEFQKQIPPFRDSLQTQIYFEILKTFGKAAGEAPPLVFEIGRNTLVNLPTNKEIKKESSVHPDYSSDNRLNEQLLLWFSIVAAFIFIVQQIKPHSGVIVIWLIITAVGLFAIAFSAVNLTDEPFSFTGGVSMWPTILLRWFTFSLALLFIFSTIRSLEANFDRLTKRYYSNNSEDNKLVTLCRDEKPYTEWELVNKWIFSPLKEMSTNIINKIIKYTTSKKQQPNDTGETVNGTNTKQRSKASAQSIKHFPNKIFSFESCVAFFLITSSIFICAYGIVEPFPKEIWILISLSFIVLSSIFKSASIRKIIFCSFKILTCLLICYAVFLIVLGFCAAFYSIHHFPPKLVIIVSLVLLICGIITWGAKIKSIQTWVQRDVIRAPSPNASKDQNNNRSYTAKAVIESKELWKEYHEHGRLKHRFLRASLKVSVFVAVAALLYQLFPVPFQPCRGDRCIALEGILRILMFSIIMLLTFLVLDAQRLCLHWIEKIRTKHPLLINKTAYENKTEKINTDEYQIEHFCEKLETLKREITKSIYISERSKSEFSNRLNVLESKLSGLEKDLGEKERDILEKLRYELESLKARIFSEYAKKDNQALKSLHDIITLVAKRTRVVDRLIYYPLIVIMLMLIARINYFDNIAFPLHVGFTVILSISLLLYAGAKLRTEAVQLKRAAINCAKELSHPDRDAVIQEIQAIDYGAFEPLFAQPAIRSLLLTLGFMSLVATEYFKLLG